MSVRAYDRALVLLIGLSALSGCSGILEKGEALDVRYYAPLDRAVTHGRSEASAAEQSALRLGRVTAASLLEVRMLSRRAHEIAYDAERRWTEPPERYLERALAHALFEEAGLPRAVAGRAPTLNAELLAFEEVVASEGPRARVVVTWMLDDERQTMAYETCIAERELPGADDGRAEVLVQALSSALDECVDKIAKRVLERLPAAPSATPPAP